MGKDLTGGLDAEQLRAVLSGERNVLVAAPPGSGKTRVLVTRFARLVASGASPEHVLAVTFTNRAAREMRERLAGVLAISTAGLNIGTFHALSLRLLKSSGAGFVLYGREHQREVLRELGVRRVEKAIDAISASKSAGAALDGEFFEAGKLYSERLRERGALDLDDLVTAAADAVEAGLAAPAFTHILIDEYQDINPAQERLVKALSGGASVFAIGDPDQSIYSFRGSTPGAFLEFCEKRPGAAAVSLEKNYRSAGRIVEASRSVISRGSSARGVVPTRPGGSVELAECADERGEASFIAGEIERAMGGLTSITASDANGASSFADFAVLARTNRQAAFLAGELSRAGLPVELVGPRKASFEELVGMLRERTGKGSLSDIVREAADSLGADGWTRGFFLGAALEFEKEGGKDANAFLDELLLSEPPDCMDIKADRVAVMTMHASKGLEFKTVFVAGVEDGLVPFLPRSGRTDMDEERRLFYVAMTRARDRLVVTRSARRGSGGEAVETRPSPFVSDIPAGIVTKRALERKKAARRPRQKGLFE